MTDEEQETSSPRAPIRRFDVFAEVNRLKAEADGRPDDEAKGYGIWLAKVVAARRFGQKADRGDGERARRPREETEATGPASRFRHVGDELQTDETFDHEIIERMGARFYDQVFAPAIEAAPRGERYESFRDSIRKDWKPAKGARQTR